MLLFEIQEIIYKQENKQLGSQKKTVGSQGNGQCNDQSDNQHNDRPNDQHNSQHNDQGKVRAWWKKLLVGEFQIWDLNGRKNPFRNDSEGRHNLKTIKQIKDPHHKN